MFNKSGCIFFIGMMSLVLAFSWAISVFVIWLICLCFSLKFSLLIATGIWLVMLLVGSVFKTTVNKEGK